MPEKMRNTIVGATVLIALGALMWLIFMFGEMPGWFTDTYAVHVELDDATGLAPGSRVRLSGIDIGSVESVHFQEDLGEGVIATCQIERAYRIPAGAYAFAQTGLLGGVGSLSIQPPRPEPNAPPVAEMLPTDGTGRLRGEAVSLTRQLERITTEIGDDLRGALENFERVSDAAIELSEQYIQVGRRLEAVFEDRLPEDVDAGRERANFMTIMARTDARLAELRQTTEAVNRLIGDEEVHNAIRRTLRNAEDLTDGARKLTAETEGRIDELTRRYVAVADDLSGAIGRLDTLLAAAQEGDGTLGRLVNDPALYNSFLDTTQRLAAAIREANLLIQKWKAEGVPFRF